jgi:DNA-binding PadR family transcriptional regulator
MFGPTWRAHEPLRQRLFERGDLKYVVLELLMEKPRHGYEIIRAIGERCAGFYAPSPGAVYPTLEMLLDMDYVTATEQDGKKIYAITDQGRAFVAERKSVIDEIRDRMGGWWNPEFRHELNDMKQELRDLGRLFDRRMRIHWADPGKLHRIREVINKARQDIQAILTEERVPQ